VVARHGGERYAAQNRRARHDYLIQETLEAGLVLMGTEVRVLRLGQCSINEAFATEREGEFYLIGAHIPEYAPASRFNHEPDRARKLLLHRKEMDRLMGAIRREGITVVPLGIYFNERGIAKCELGLAKGRKKADKREAEKAKDWQKEKGRLLRERG
jgi:SsrA-binding protein